jgi:hypothetical protein
MKHSHLGLRIRYTLRAPGRTRSFCQKLQMATKFDVPTVRKEGDIKWQGVNIFININELLRHEPVGLRQIEDDLFEVYFGATLLGEIDGYRKTFIGRKVGDGRCLG